MENHKVSVIMVNYNYGKYISHAIESVLNQTYANFELIVADDASTDNSKEVIEGYGDKIKFIKLKSNGGPYIARNVAIKEASGDFIALMDADDVWDKDKLNIQLEYMRHHTDVDFVYSGYNMIDEDGGVIAGLEDYYLRREPVEGWVFNEFIKRNFVLLSTVVVRSEVFQKVGLFDETFRLAGDYYMWLKISRYYKVGFINKQLVNNRRHSHNLTNNRLAQAVGAMRILHKILQYDPGIWDEIPGILDKRSKELFSDLYFLKALEVLDVRDFKKARYWFVRAIKHKPLRIKIYVYYLISFLRQPALIPYIRSTTMKISGSRGVHR